MPADRLSAGMFDEEAYVWEEASPVPATPPAKPAATNGTHAPSHFKSRPITDFTYPEDNDPNILLGSDDFLGRGGGMLFISYAGVGKSTFMIGACMGWALGRPCMGIKSNGPLRSLIVQAEDSDRYVGKVVESYCHVHGFTAEERALAGERCHVVRIKGLCGPDFLLELKKLIADHRPDLVVINPIYIYAQGDIGRSEFAQPFLLGLDALNAKETFGYILVHHTGKPAAKGNNGKRAETEDWEGAYMGFGSSYLANWPRCSALLEPVAKKSGAFVLKLGKGRYNAGITREVDQGAGKRLETVTSVRLRHSTATMPVKGQERPVYCWEVDDSPIEEATSNAGGRPTKYNVGQFIDIFPTSKETAMPRAQLFRLALDLVKIPESSFRNVLYEGADEGVILRIKTKTGFSYYVRPQTA